MHPTRPKRGDAGRPETDADTVAEESSRPSPADGGGAIESAADTIVDLRAASSAPSPVDVTPTTLDDGAFDNRYALGRVLGEGGMGEIRLCSDHRIGRQVAVKVLKKGQGSQSESKDRFEREARIQGQLEHPNIVPVYDLGTRADGATFFTMKRVRGLTLEDIVHGLKRCDPDIARIYSRRKLLSAFSQVCLTVAFAHSRGVVHRDLKPANVILGEFGEVYVLDWGVAKLIEHEESGGVARESRPCPRDLVSMAAKLSAGPANITEAGTVLGTPGYMAPEQIFGEGDDLDGRADVYALGAILFELLTLEPLHEPTSVPAVLKETVQGVEGSPSAKVEDGDIPPELDAICVRATARDVDDRFQSARELHDAIEAFLDGDRDQERRRELARQHIEKARAAFRAAGDREGKAKALRELNSALALDPGNATAVEAMVRLFVESSADLPSEAERELHEVRTGELSRVGQMLTFVFLGCLLTIPILFWTGIRSWAPVIAVAANLIALSLFSFVMSRVSRQRALYGYIFATLGAALAGVISTYFGPFVVAPGMALAFALPSIVNTRASRSLRRFYILVSVLAVFGPASMQWLGVFPQTTVFQDGIITILPWAVDFTPFRSHVLMSIMTATIIIVPLMVIGPTIDALVRAERRLFAQKWNLRNLMPEQVRGAADEALAEPRTDRSCSPKTR